MQRKWHALEPHKSLWATYGQGKWITDAIPHYWANTHGMMRKLTLTFWNYQHTTSLRKKSNRQSWGGQQKKHPGQTRLQATQAELITPIGADPIKFRTRAKLPLPRRQASSTAAGRSRSIPSSTDHGCQINRNPLLHGCQLTMSDQSNPLLHGCPFNATLTMSVQSNAPPRMSVQFNPNQASSIQSPACGCQFSWTLTKPSQFNPIASPTVQP